MVSDGYLSLSRVVMGSPNLRSLGDGSLSSNVEVRYRLMVQKDWVVAASHSSKMRHYHGSRADEIRSTTRRKPDGMHRAVCISTLKDHIKFTLYLGLTIRRRRNG